MAQPFSPPKLRLLALHSFRTSSRIFQQQVKFSGLGKKLDHLIELVYVDAPHLASGPAPADVAAFFQPPYREWWRSDRSPDGGELVYAGSEETIEYMEKVIMEQGPFDGVWAFSQGSLLATILLSLQHKKRILQEAPALRFAVIFGGFHRGGERLQGDKLAQEAFQEGVLLPHPSCHVIGEKDALRKYSNMLAEQYSNPLILTHPRGHVIPALSDETFESLETFLKEQQLAAEEADSLATSLESSRL